MFRAVSVFPDSFTLTAAAAIMGREVLDVIDVLGRLVDKSLVLPVEAPAGTDRYQLLETLRQYGRDRLFDHGEAEVRRNGLLAWSLSHVELLERDMHTPSMDAALAAVMPERTNLRAAMEWAAEQDDATAALRLATAVPMGLPSERRVLITDFLARGGDHHPALVVRGRSSPCPTSHSIRATGPPRSMPQSTHKPDSNRPVTATAPRRRGSTSSSAAGERGTSPPWTASCPNSWPSSERATTTSASRPRSGSPPSASPTEKRQLLWRRKQSAGTANSDRRAWLRTRSRDAPSSSSTPASSTLPHLSCARRSLASRGASNLGCTAHALEAVAVWTASHGDRRATAELVSAADMLRDVSGAGHKPWEARARYGDYDASVLRGYRRRPRGDRGGRLHSLASAAALADAC